MFTFDYREVVLLNVKLKRCRSKISSERITCSTRTYPCIVPHGSLRYYPCSTEAGSVLSEENRVRGVVFSTTDDVTNFKGRAKLLGENIVAYWLPDFRFWCGGYHNGSDKPNQSRLAIFALIEIHGFQITLLGCPLEVAYWRSRSQEWRGNERISPILQHLSSLFG